MYLSKIIKWSLELTLKELDGDWEANMAEMLSEENLKLSEAMWSHYLSFNDYGIEHFWDLNWFYLRKVL